MAQDNGKYKDRLFNYLFGAEENKAWTLSLYNAVNGSSYDDPSKITITTIREILYLGMHNDVSFMISNEMNLYEQQSTYNPNMPLRLLQYSGNLYEKYIKENGYNKFGKSLIPLPVPKLVVFYNGKDDQPDERILRLADSFPEGADADIEVRVRMLNINAGKSHRLLEACEPLGEYAWLVEEIRQGAADDGADSAVDRAISKMPDGFKIKPFLVAHRAEVKGMLLTEYNEAEAMELFKEDGRREGREEGLKEGLEQGRLLTLISLVREGVLSMKLACERAQMTESSFRKKMLELS